MNMERLKGQLILDEAVRPKMYLDSEGIETIGVGHNLRDRPISDRAIQVILEDDIEAMLPELERLPIYRKLDDVRQTAIANMAFNLGVPRLLEFRKMWAALDRQDWIEAAKQMLDSKWAKQVGARSARLAKIIERGAFP